LGGKPWGHGVIFIFQQSRTDGHKGKVLPQEKNEVGGGDSRLGQKHEEWVSETASGGGGFKKKRFKKTQQKREEGIKKRNI